MGGCKTLWFSMYANFLRPGAALFCSKRGKYWTNSLRLCWQLFLGRGCWNSFSVHAQKQISAVCRTQGYANKSMWGCPRILIDWRTLTMQFSTFLPYILWLRMNWVRTILPKLISEQGHSCYKPTFLKNCMILGLVCTCRNRSLNLYTVGLLGPTVDGSCPMNPPDAWKHS